MILHLILFPFPIPVLGFVIESNMSLQKKKIQQYNILYGRK